jgi:hypothetical protein
MSYPGGKNGQGTFQRIINLIPPHEVYVEAFAGAAAIARLKRPAGRTILIDLDPGAIAALGGMAGHTGGNGDGRGSCRQPPADLAVRSTLPRLPAETEVVDADGIRWLREHAGEIGPSWFVYLDPPYLPETCKSRPQYRYNLDYDGHCRLLFVAKRLRCPVMISGRWSRLYAEQLDGWASQTWYAMTRGATMGQECVWTNYPLPPTALHDYRFLGRDYRQRENLARRRRRWVERLARMGTLERQMLLAAMQEVDLVSPPDPAGRSPPAKTAVGSANGRNGDAAAGDRASAKRAVRARTGRNGDGRSTRGGRGGGGHLAASGSNNGRNGGGARAGTKNLTQRRKGAKGG